MVNVTYNGGSQNSYAVDHNDADHETCHVSESVSENAALLIPVRNRIDVLVLQWALSVEWAPRGCPAVSVLYVIVRHNHFVDFTRL